MIKETQPNRRLEAINELSTRLTKADNIFQERRTSARILTEIGGLLAQTPEKAAESAYLAALQFNELDISNSHIKDQILGILKFLAIQKFQEEGKPTIYRQCEEHEKIELFPIAPLANDKTLGNLQEFWEELIQESDSVDQHDGYIIPNLNKIPDSVKLQGIFALFKQTEARLRDERSFRYVRDNEAAKAIISYMFSNDANTEEIRQIFPNDKKITEYFLNTGIVRLATGEDDKDYYYLSTQGIAIVSRLDLAPDPEEN